MLLNSWLPLHDMRRTLKEVDRMFDLANAPSVLRQAVGATFPAIDLYNQEDQSVLVAEVPGIDPEKLEVTVHEDTLTLKGERVMNFQEGEHVLRRERVYGSFNRTITLPDSVDPESIVAEYHDGILTVTMKKAAVAKPRRINVQS